MIKEVKINNWPGLIIQVWVFCSVTTVGSDMFWKWFKGTIMCQKLCVGNVWAVKGRGRISCFVHLSHDIVSFVCYRLSKLSLGFQCKYCSSESRILVCLPHWYSTALFVTYYYLYRYTLLYEILLSSSAAGIPEKYSKILTPSDFKPLSVKH